MSEYFALRQKKRVKLLPNKVRFIKCDKNLVDKWDMFTIKYSLYYPLKEGEYMRINGDSEKLGNWNSEKGGPVKMIEGPA